MISKATGNLGYRAKPFRWAKHFLAAIIASAAGAVLALALRPFIMEDSFEAASDSSFIALPTTLVTLNSDQSHRVMRLNLTLEIGDIFQEKIHKLTPVIQDQINRSITKQKDNFLNDPKLIEMLSRQLYSDIATVLDPGMLRKVLITEIIVE